MSRSKKLFTLAAAGLLALSIGTGVSAESTKDTLVIAEDVDCGTLAPTGPTISTRTDIYLQVYDGLFRFDGNSEMVPGLATDWEWLDDTHIKFNLREGVKYHDGRDFTAKDVLFSIKLCQEDSNMVAVVTNVDYDACEILDDYTIVIAFTEKNAFNLSKLNMMNIVNEESYNESSDGMATSPVGTGPYKFESSVPGASYTLVANEESWDKVPAIEHITFEVIPEASQRTNSLLAGEVDLVKALQNSDYDYIGGMEEYTVGKRAGFNSTDIFFNMTENSPFVEKALRQAVCYTVDNEAMNTAAYGGLSIPCTGPWSVGMHDYDASWTNPMYDSPDFDKAKELVDSVGAPSEPITIIYGGDAACETISQILQANLAQIGITAEIVSVDSSVLWSTMSDQTQWDIGLLGASAPSGYGLDSMTAFLTGLNFQGWSGENFDKLVELCQTGAAASSDEERIAATKEIWDLVEEEVPLYAMVTLSNLYAHVSNLNYEVYDQFSLKGNNLIFS